MSDPKDPRMLSDEVLEGVSAAARPAHTPEWTDHNTSDPGLLAHELTHRVQQDGTRGVWKAPAGTEASVTHDPEFESWTQKP